MDKPEWAAQGNWAESSTTEPPNPLSKRERTVEILPHTPTPWTSETNRTMQAIKGPNGEPTCFYMPTERNRGYSEEVRYSAKVDVPFVLRAVNCHAELLEAVNEVIYNWGSGISGLSISENNRLLVKLCETANKAEGR